MNHGRGQRQLFLHAVRVVRYQSFGRVGELHEVEQLGRALGRSLTIQTIHTAHEVQIFGSGQSSKQCHTFRHDSDLPFDLHHLADQIEAENLNSPGGRREQAGEHLDGRGLSGAIRSQKAEELAGSHSKIHVFDGDEVSEPPRQIFRGNGRGDHESSDSSTTEPAGRAPARREWTLMMVISLAADQTGTIGLSAESELKCDKENRGRRSSLATSTSALSPLSCSYWFSRLFC